MNFGIMQRTENLWPRARRCCTTEVAADFSAEKIEGINQRVQAGQAAYPDFVREGAAAGCAYYIVYLNGKKVRYFGRDGGEYVQHFPGSR